MKRSFVDYLIVFIVIACCVVLLGALSTALTGYRLNKPTRVLQIDFPDVAGIQLHSELRYAGAPAGEVIQIRPLTHDERVNGPTGPENAVRVTVAISEGVPPFPHDVKATIGSDTMLSEKYVALSAGTPGTQILADNTILAGQPAFNLDSLGPKLEPILTNANLSLIDVRKNLNELLPEIKALAGKIEVTSESATSLLKRAEKLIDDNEEDIHARIEELGKVLEQVGGVLTQTETTVANANVAIGSANDFIGSTDRELQARMRELGVIMQNLKVISTQAKAITQSVAEKPSRLIWGFGRPVKLTPEAEILRSDRPVPALRPARDKGER